VSTLPGLRLLRPLCLCGVTALLLSGCAMNNTASVRSRDYSDQSAGQTSSTIGQLESRYKANPNDKATAISYAAALRAAGQPAQSVSVIEAAMVNNPNDVDLKVNYAKALTATGRYDQALTVITDAIRPDAPDWDALLVKGAILDQTGQNAAARATYSQALLIAPNQPAIEADIGLSYAMTNDLTNAEAHLRKAASMPGATSKIRQNLALVIGLEGRFDEARRLFAAELPPDQVDANMAYIKGMMTQQNRWNAIQQAG
jgi:Flp pilus assembly protein TadD